MTYGNTQSLFYELFYELILNPKLELFISYPEMPLILLKPVEYVYVVCGVKFYFKDNFAAMQASALNIW